jgi:hypothetical protein
MMPVLLALAFGFFAALISTSVGMHRPNSPPAIADERFSRTPQALFVTTSRRPRGPS